MGEEAAAPLTVGELKLEKLLEYLEKLDGVAYVVVSREGLPVHVSKGVATEKAEALAALGEEAFRRVEESLGEVGGGRVAKLGVDLSGGRMYITRLDGGVLIYQAVPGLADEISTLIENLKQGRLTKCEKCGRDLTLEIYTCPSCGRKVPFTIRVCPHCGSNIDVKRCPGCNTLIRSDGSRVKPPTAIMGVGIAAGLLMLGIAAYAALTGLLAAALIAGVGGIAVIVGTLAASQR